MTDAADLNAGSFVFNDRKGRSWDVTITNRSWLRVDKADYADILPGEFSFLRPTEQLWQELYGNPFLIGAVIWHIISPQADERGISEDDFADSLDGPTLVAAKAALWGALAHFFPEKKTALSQLATLYEKAQTMLAEKVNSRSQQIDETMATFLDREMDAAFRELASEPLTTSANSSPPAASV